MIVKRAVWWDYKKEASYFITFNVLNKQKKLGEVRSKIMNLNQLGLIVDDCIKEINSQDSNVTISTYCIMPDHVHLILEFKKPIESNLKVYKYPSDCIRVLKAKSAFQIRKSNSKFQWQDNFYEIIIKNIYHHQKVIDYIKNKAKNYNI